MERTEGGRRKERIHVSAAALVGLKAALFHKQREFKREKSAHNDISAQSNRTVSEKTASIWQRVGEKREKREKRGSKLEREGEERKREISIEEEAELARSRQALEAKAALYEKLSRGEGLKLEEEEEEEGGGERYMVDFTRKLAEEIGQKRDLVSESKREGEGEGGEEEWVDYVDSLGRSRRCLEKDLPDLMEMDRKMREHRESRSPSPDLLSGDMRREREREGWEQQALQEVEQEKPVGPLHYQEVQHGEIRTHGVGYFAFSSDETKRGEQMNLLSKLREQTLQQKEKRQKLQEKRKALMEARLAKVRERKLGQQGGEKREEGKGEIKGIADIDFEQQGKEDGSSGKKEPSQDLSALIGAELSRAREEVERERVKEEEEKRATHVRPWDRGKVVDPIKRRKRELEDERLPEFAPPSSYLKSSSVPKKFKPSDPTTERTVEEHSTRSNVTFEPTVPVSSTSVTDAVTETQSRVPVSAMPQVSSPYFFTHTLPTPPSMYSPYYIPPPPMLFGVPPPPPHVNFVPHPPGTQFVPPPPPPGAYFAPPPPPHYPPYSHHPHPSTGGSGPFLSPWQPTPL